MLDPPPEPEEEGRIAIRVGGPGTKSVRVRAGETARLDFGPSENGALVHGAVCSGGRPLEAGEVLLSVAAGGPEAALTRRRAPVAGGRYRLEDVDPGR